MRSALFSPLAAEDDRFGSMVETALFSQWLHEPRAALHYGRWGEGEEIDLIALDAVGSPARVAEIKWSDRIEKRPEEGLTRIVDFCEAQGLAEATVYTRTVSKELQMGTVKLSFVPASLASYEAGL